MREWIAGIVGEDMATGAMLVVVTLAIVLAFLILFAIFKGFSGTGVRSNRRNRQASLAVMDAAVVDSRRRLVLVRRDDVEHLILIGGPTDVVVEQNISRQNPTKSTKTQHPRNQAVAPHQSPSPTKQPERTVAATKPLETPAPRAAAAPATPSAPAVNEKPNPVQSPQIRPVTKPSIPAASKPAPTAPVPVPLASTQRPAPRPAPPKPAAAPQAAADTDLSPRLGVPANTASSLTAPSTTASSGKPSSHGTILAQASASSVAAVPIAAAMAPAARPQAYDETGDVTDNQLADFEDNLAMNLGETLVQEEKPSDKGSLASEMDELLSEITSRGKS